MTPDDLDPKPWRGDPQDIFASDHVSIEVIARALSAGRPAWTDDAACRGSDLDFTSPAITIVSACLQVCGRCSQRERCRDWADEIGDAVAILGGEDPGARKARWRVRGINQRKATDS